MQNVAQRKLDQNPSDLVWNRENLFYGKDLVFYEPKSAYVVTSFKLGYHSSFDGKKF